MDCKSSGREPVGKMTSSRFKSRVVMSPYVSSVGGDKRIAARVDKSAGGNRQSRQVARREQSMITKSHEGTEPRTNRLRQSASSFSWPGM